MLLQLLYYFTNHFFFNKDHTFSAMQGRNQTGFANAAFMIPRIVFSGHKSQEVVNGKPFIINPLPPSVAVRKQKKIF